MIQQRLANPLATALLEQRINPGDTVEIDWDGHDFTFSPAVPADGRGVSAAPGPGREWAEGTEPTRPVPASA